MLIWFTPGWEDYVKWGAKEEAEIAHLMLNKWEEIIEATLYVKKNKDESIEINMGLGPGGRLYSIFIAYIGTSREYHDFMQMCGLAPITEIQGNIIAKSLPTDIPDKVSEYILIARMYDDGNPRGIRIIGEQENKRIGKKIFDVFKPL